MVAFRAAAFGIGIEGAAASAVGQRFPAQTEINVTGFAAAVAVKSGLSYDIHAIGSFKCMPAMRTSEN